MSCTRMCWGKNPLNEEEKPSETLLPELSVMDSTSSYNTPPKRSNSAASFSCQRELLSHPSAKQEGCGEITKITAQGPKAIALS